MPDYGVAYNQAAASTAYKTALAIAAAAAAASGIQLRRGRLFDINIGQSGPPNSTDTSIQWDVSRFSSYAGFTLTTQAPNPDDSADPVFMGQCGVNATVEGTYSAQGSGLGLLNFVINQRAAYRWISKDGKELVYPATANLGIGVRALVVTSGYVGPIAGTLQFTE
jgi:hypothetical protein